MRRKPWRYRGQDERSGWSPGSGYGRAASRRARRRSAAGHGCTRCRARPVTGCVAKDVASRSGESSACGPRSPRGVRIAGQGGQQPRGRWRQRHRSPAGLAVGKPQLAGVGVDVLPAQLLDLAAGSRTAATAERVSEPSLDISPRTRPSRLNSVSSLPRPMSPKPESRDLPPWVAHALGIGPKERLTQATPISVREKPLLSATGGPFAGRARKR